MGRVRRCAATHSKSDDNPHSTPLNQEKHYTLRQHPKHNLSEHKLIDNISSVVHNSEKSNIELPQLLPDIDRPIMRC